MLIEIDIGNTNITLGLYPEKEITHAWRLATAHERMPDEYGLQLLGLLEHADCAPGMIEAIALASVWPRPRPRGVKPFLRRPRLYRRFRHGDDLRCDLPGGGLSRGSDSPWDRDRLGSAVPANGKAAPGRPGTAVGGDRSQHGDRYSVGTGVRLRRAG